jgi:Tol biopolymer transport system component
VDVTIIAWSADGQKLAFHVGESQGIETEDGADLEVPKVNYGNFVFDGKQATKIELPAEVIAWLPDGSFLLSEAGQAQPATTRLLHWEIGQAAAPVALPAGHYGQVQVGRGWRYAVASVASAIGKDSRIVRWDLKKAIPEAVTTSGGWAEYQWPRLSPDEQQVAFLRGPELWVRDHNVLRPAQQLVNYDWIDDQTLVVETPGELIVVGTDRQVRGRVSVVARDGGP